MPRGPKKQIPQSEVSQLINDVHGLNINARTRELFLMGYAGDSQEEDPGVDYRSAGTFLKNLHILETLGRSKIIVHMQITGGEWSYGMGIYNAIQAAKSSVTIVAYAHATSMSGVILQAADNRILMPDTHFMLHYGSLGIESTSQAVLACVEQNERDNKRMLEIFAERAVEGPHFRAKRWGVKRVSDYIDHEMRQKGDWYLSATEAVEYGFADGVLGRDITKV